MLIVYIEFSFLIEIFERKGYSDWLRGQERLVLPQEQL
jgi:hypothetical protein